MASTATVCVSPVPILNEAAAADATVAVRARESFGETAIALRASLLTVMSVLPTSAPLPAVAPIVWNRSTSRYAPARSPDRAACRWRPSGPASLVQTSPARSASPADRAGRSRAGRRCACVRAGRAGPRSVRVQAVAKPADRDGRHCLVSPSDPRTTPWRPSGRFQWCTHSRRDLPNDLAGLSVQDLHDDAVDLRILADRELPDGGDRTRLLRGRQPPCPGGFRLRVPHRLGAELRRSAAVLERRPVALRREPPSDAVV